MPSISTPWHAYTRALDTHPYTARAATAAVLAAASELTAARLTHRPRSLRRLALLALWGGAVSGPSGHAWQLLLARWFGRLPPRAALAARTAADAFVYGPIVNALALAYMRAVVDGRRAGVGAHVKRAWPGAQARAWRLWPAASLVAYAAVPPRLRTPFFNVVAYGWGVALILSAR
jgi:protein Mpv17